MKSMLAMFLGLHLSRGYIFGTECEPRNVIYVDRENPDTLVRSRADRMNLELLGTENNLWYWGMWHQTPPPPFVMDDLYIKLVEGIERPVIIFDSLMRFHNKDENDAGQMSLVTMAFRDLCAKGATVVLLHHKGKPKLEGPTTPYRGSSEISAACDIGYSVSKKHDKVITLELECFKNRFEEEKTLTFKFCDDALGRRFEPTNGAALPKADVDVAILKFFIETNGGLGAAELANKSKIGINRVRDILASGIDKWWTEQTLDKNKKVYFRILEGD
jgi:hypothetical protein